MIGQDKKLPPTPGSNQIVVIPTRALRKIIIKDYVVLKPGLTKGSKPSSIPYGSRDGTKLMKKIEAETGTT